METTRKIVLIGIFLLPSILFLGKLGLFDPLVIKIDNFVFRKPLLYRYSGEESSIKLNSSNFGSTTFTFSGIFENKIAIYTISKASKKAYNIDLNLTSANKNISKKMLFDCLILEEKRDAQAANKKLAWNSVSIYKFPYVIHFSEINKERESEAVQQFCKKKNKVYLSERSRQK